MFLAASYSKEQDILRMQFNIVKIRDVTTCLYSLDVLTIQISLENSLGTIIFVICIIVVIADVTLTENDSS